MWKARRRALTALIAAVSAAVALNGAPLLAQCGGEDESPGRRANVRSSNPLIANLMADAALHSATFKGLLATLASTNGIVHVESGRCGHGARACLQIWMVASGGRRYLRVLVDRQRADSDVDLTGSIGHELQHAVEALSDAKVIDGTTMYGFFRRYAPTDNNHFETAAAITIGNAIRDELRHQSPLARGR
jgi:hypothetical protein